MHALSCFAPCELTKGREGLCAVKSTHSLQLRDCALHCTGCSSDYDGLVKVEHNLDDVLTQRCQGLCAVKSPYSLQLRDCALRCARQRRLQHCLTVSDAKDTRENMDEKCSCCHASLSSPSGDRVSEVSRAPTACNCATAPWTTGRSGHCVVKLTVPLVLLGTAGAKQEHSPSGVRVSELSRAPTACSCATAP